MNCPNCASEHTQRFSAIFEAGTTTIESKSSGGGVALTKGGLTPILTGSSSTGTHQTRLAARATPPARRRVGGPIVGAIVVSPILGVLAVLATGALCVLADAETETASKALEGIFWVTLAMASIGFAALAVTGHKFNQEEWPALQREWTRKWYCLRCGTDFVDREGTSSTTSTFRPGKIEPGQSRPSSKPSALLKTRTVKPVQALVGLAIFAALLHGGMAVVSPSQPDAQSFVISPRSSNASPLSVPAVERSATNRHHTQLHENYDMPLMFMPDMTADELTDEVVKYAGNFRSAAKQVTLALQPLDRTGRTIGTIISRTDAIDRDAIRAEVVTILGK